MKLRQLAATAALAGLSATASASLTLNFDDPALVGVNPDDSQTLVEQGYALDGPLFSFQPIDNGGNGVIVGDGTPFSLRQIGGGIFSLLRLDAAFDPTFGGPAGSLSVVGLFNGAQVALQTLTLGPLSSFVLDDSFLNLTSVRFSATSGFAVDNLAVAAIPEPASWALIGMGLAGLALSLRRSRRTAIASGA